MQDRQLVNRVLAGDKECFSELVRRYSSAVYAAVLNLTKRRETSMELTQQTFVRAYERLEYFRSESMKGWLLTIAYHLALNVLERERLHRNIPAEGADVLEAEHYSAEHEQRLQAMERAIATLPADDRDIIRQHYFLGASTKEIAERKQMTQSNVLVRLHRIRARLKEQIERFCK